MELYGIPDPPPGVDPLTWAFHVRAFGVEMARINFLPYEERRAWCDRSLLELRKSGVKMPEDPPEITGEL